MKFDSMFGWQFQKHPGSMFILGMEVIITSSVEYSGKLLNK